jgi:Acetyltransferases, including N-acetylases of ribosomal proteins
MAFLTHKGTQTIETSRLILRKFTIDDAEHMYTNWANSSKVTEFLSWPPHESVDVSRQVLASWIESYENDNYYSWGIELKEIGQVIGSIAVMSIAERRDNCAIGYCLGEKFWNIGLMTEALNAVIDFLFNEVNFHRIYAVHDVNNIGSGKVMEKVGMQVEGIQRDAHFNNNGTYSDMRMLSILKKDRE